MLSTSRWRGVWAIAVAAAATAASLVVPSSATAGSSASSAPDVPYRLGAPLPTPRQSPGVDPRAPYTPLVRSLIHQLEPDSPLTIPELQNAAKLFQGLITFFPGAPADCNGIGGVVAPTGTTPSISPLCWADSVGV